MPMSTKQKFLVVALVLVAIISACSITIQVQKNNTNSTQENSQETNQSADSARVNFHLNP
jgi:outer membrane biogenesis lipoprotein LolB